MKYENPLFEYLLRIGDNELILGHRVSEWCGHGPILEQDIALTNIALDLIGQCRSVLQYAGEVEGKGRDEDQLAYLRDENAYRNVLLVELPNGNFGDTITRQFLFDSFHYYFFHELKSSSDKHLSAIAEKSLKEITYHLRFSSEWMIRLGDGTEESHEKMQNAVNNLWPYSGELTQSDELDKIMLEQGIGVDLDKVKSYRDEKIADILREATLTQPEESWMQQGGKSGRHTEHLGFILTELQFLQRAYPGAKW